MNKLIIVSLVACLCSCVYGRDLLYGTFEQEYSGSIKAQIDKNITEFSTKANKLKVEYEEYVANCKKSFRSSRNYKEYTSCTRKQGILFEKKFGGRLAYVIGKIKLSIENIYVADIFKSAKEKESIGKLGIKFDKEYSERNGVEVKIYVKLKNEHYSDFVFTYGVVEKFENGRVKLLSDQAMWINIDDIKEVFKFKDDVFKLTREELKKKYTIGNKCLSCQNSKYRCVHCCGVYDLTDDSLRMDHEDVEAGGSAKILIEELLNENGEFDCSVHSTN